jgi:hypothetical protein
MAQVPMYVHGAAAAAAAARSGGGAAAAALPARPMPLKVGYLSCDFGDHPVGRLFAFVRQAFPSLAVHFD